MSHLPATRRAILAGLVLPATGVAFPAAAASHPDAALIAMGPVIAELIANADRVTRDLVAAEEVVQEMTMPVPVEPRDIQAYPTDAAYREAMQRFEVDTATWLRRRSEANTTTGLPALEDAQEAAETAVMTACMALADERATTLDGLRLKARFAERGHWEVLSRSIVVDLLAMGGDV